MAEDANHPRSAAFSPCPSLSMPAAARPGPPAPVDIDLRGAHLRDQDLAARAWSRVDLIRADLSGARLDRSDLREARLHGARLRGASLVAVQASGCHARDLDVEGADLSGARFDRADLQSAILLDAQLVRTDLRAARLCHADLRGADLRGADLRDADLRWADLTGAQLDGAQLEGARATGARLGRRLSTTAEGAALAAAGAASSRSRGSRTALSRRGIQVGADVARLGTRRLSVLQGQLRSLGRGARDEIQRQLDEARALRERRRANQEAPVPRPTRRPPRPASTPPDSAPAAPSPRQTPAERRAAERARVVDAGGEWGQSAQRRQDDADRAAAEVRSELARRAQEREQRRIEEAARRAAAAEARARALEEEERRAEEDRRRAARERALREERRLQEEREAERAAAEAARREQEAAEQARAAAALAEQARLAAKQAEEQERAEEEARRAEAARRAEELAALRAAEEARKAEEEARRLEAERVAEEQAAQARRAEARARQAEEAAQRAADAARREEAARKSEAERQERAEQAREAERRAQAERAQAAAAEAARIRAREQRAREAAAAARSEESRALVERERARAEAEAAAQQAAAEQARELAAAAERRAQAEQAARQLAEQRARDEAARRVAEEQARAEAQRLQAQQARAAAVAAQRAAEAQAAEARRVEALRRSAEAARRQAGRSTRAAEAQRQAEAQRRREELARAEEAAAAAALAATEAAQAAETAAQSAQAASAAAPQEPDPERVRLGLQVREQTRRVQWSFDQQQRAHTARTRVRPDTAEPAPGEPALAEEGPVRAREAAPTTAPTAPEQAPVAAPPVRPPTRQRPWLAWLRGAPPPDLPEGRGVDLTGADLRGLRLDGRQWPEARLRGAQLSSTRLRDANLQGADLAQATLESARLSGAVLREADLSDAILDGARLRATVLQDAVLRGARLIDVDLRGADLAGADLRNADLTGADLRRVQLAGTDLRGANLSAVRMSDLDLADSLLDGALLDQADLAGTDFSRASLDQTDLSGALGLSGRDRESLARAGARTRDEALDQLVGRVASRQVRTAAAVLAIGVGAYLGARFLAATDPDPATLEATAEEQRETDPLAAAATYEELARSSQRLTDRVGYLLEAAALAERGGARDQAGRLVGAALEEAGDDPALGTDVRLRAARLHATQEEWTELMVMVEPVVRGGGLPVDLRAQAVVLYRQAAAEAGVEPTLADALLEELAAIPESEADLRMAIADIRSAEGDLPAALAELDRVAELDLTDELRLRALEARARILDRDGRSEAAAEAWSRLMAAAPAGEPSWQAARLALADLRHRMGDTSEAQELVEALLAPDTDPRIRARAILVDGRLLEQAGDTEGARARFQEALEVEDMEPETREEARMSLARLLLGSGDEAAIAAALENLPEEARDGILLHARLGEARSLLDQGRAAAALDVYEAILDGSSTERSAVRAARAGQAECLATMGQLAEAVEIWRAQLADDPTDEERGWLELQLAHGLLQGGDAAEARAAFTSLSASPDADTRDQGALGLAEVARRSGERERARSLYTLVARRASDAAFQVQAWQELADMAVEDGKDEDARAAWRGVLGVVPPGSPAAAEARMSLMLHLADRGELDRAISLCQETLATAAPHQTGPAHLACAELMERAEQPAAAVEHYEAALRLELAADRRTDAGLGLARIHMDAGSPEAAAAVVAAVLVDVESAELRLPLLAARVQALEAHAPEDENAATARDAARAEQRELVSAAPAMAGPILLDAAQRARSAGNTDEAVALFQEATALPAEAGWRAGALIELGDTLLDDGRPTAAQVAYDEALAVDLDGTDPHTAFSAGMGRASAMAMMGDPESALEQLEDLEAPDARARQWWLESQAQAHQQAGDMAGALEDWTTLASLVQQDPPSLAGALRGQADALLAMDRPTEALAVFREAASHSSDASLLGWLSLGEAAALRESGEHEAALEMMASLVDHPDPEVQLQARIRRAQAFSAAEQWQAALEEITEVGASALGPGWDATLAETRAAAWTALGELEQARGEWQRLARAWPDEEEALLPAWLGLASVALASGDEDRARALAKQALERAEDPVYRAQAVALMADLPAH